MYFLIKYNNKIDKNKKKEYNTDKNKNKHRKRGF